MSLPLQEGCSRAKQHPGLVQTLKTGQCHRQETARAPLAAEPLVKTKQQDRIRKQEAQGSDCMAFKNQRSVMCLAPVGSGGLLFTLTPTFFQKGTRRDQQENSCRGHSCPSEKGTSPTMRHAMQRKWTSRWRQKHICMVLLSPGYGTVHVTGPQEHRSNMADEGHKPSHRDLPLEKESMRATGASKFLGLGSRALAGLVL